MMKRICDIAKIIVFAVLMLAAVTIPVLLFVWAHGGGFANGKIIP